MKRKWRNIHIGLRTVKTAVAVIVAMILVELYGTTDSKLIFAMLGAMAAVQPTFKESVESCLTQIVGVLFGAAMGVMLLMLKLPPLVAVGIGIVLTITLYNFLHIRFSPSLPCFILVMLCTGGESQPMSYALGRIWDTAIGLTVGMLINTLVFPYDNSWRIRSTAQLLDRELILFLEDMFDGDGKLPDTKVTTRAIDDMARQLEIFSNQKLILRLQRQRQELEAFRACEQKARQLVAQMEVLRHLDPLGRLDLENQQRLLDCGAVVVPEETEATEESDVVTNYLVSQLLMLRQELLETLEN